MWSVVLFPYEVTALHAERNLWGFLGYKSRDIRIFMKKSCLSVAAKRRKGFFFPEISSPPPPCVPK